MTRQREIARTRSIENAEFPRRCFACFRPLESCFCADIPSIDNQTDILILQHRRERTHPFNTARMVDRALHRSRLICGRNAELAVADLPIQPDAGLLYPGKNARLLNELLPHEQPPQLVILDGTWHHARTMFRDIPHLHALPRYQLAPATPGQFRIRLEPNDTALSTVEATVAALRSLEPDTQGLDQLLSVFSQMNERQLAHPNAVYDRIVQTTQYENFNIPKSLTGDLSNVVVVYGETLPMDDRKSPIYWVAQRLGPGASSQTDFASLIEPTNVLPEGFLRHLDLSQQDFRAAVSIDQFRIVWEQFIKSDDLLVAYQKNTIRMLENIGVPVPQFELLKAINYDPAHERKTLDHVVTDRHMPLEPPRHRGRAGRRLANAIALLRHLNSRTL